MGAPRSPNRKSSRLSSRALLTAYAEASDIELLFLDPPETFDAAIIGVIYGYSQEPAVLYDEAIILAALQQEGMSEDEARESFDVNTAGAWLGPATPRFLIQP